MTKASDEKWEKASADLPAKLRPILKQLREDYLASARQRVPAYAGGPSAAILADLVRQGWHK